MDLLPHFFRPKSDSAGKGQEEIEQPAPIAESPLPEPASIPSPSAVAPRWRLDREQPAGATRFIPQPESPAVEVTLILDDVLPRVPTHALKPGLHDPDLPLRFPAAELTASLARGRPAVRLSRLAASYPGIFETPASEAEDAEVVLPIAKILQQMGVARAHAETAPPMPRRGPFADPFPPAPAPERIIMRRPLREPPAPLPPPPPVVSSLTSAWAPAPEGNVAEASPVPSAPVAEPPAGYPQHKDASVAEASRLSSPLSEEAANLMPPVPVRQQEDATPTPVIAIPSPAFAQAERSAQEPGRLRPQSPLAAEEPTPTLPAPFQAREAPPEAPPTPTPPAPFSTREAPRQPAPAPTPPPPFRIFAGPPMIRPPRINGPAGPAPITQFVAEPTASVVMPPPAFVQPPPAEPAPAPPIITPEAVETPRVKAEPEPEPSSITPVPVPEKSAPLEKPPEFFILDQEPLQAIFMTDEELDLPRISELSAGLPGITGCMILAGDHLTQGGERPTGLDALTLRELSRKLSGTVEEFKDKLPAESAFTLYGGNRALSIFSRTGLCLCVVHAPRGFLPGVRERLSAVADSLARGVYAPGQEPAAAAV